MIFGMINVLDEIRKIGTVYIVEMGSKKTRKIPKTGPDLRGLWSGPNVKHMQKLALSDSYGCVDCKCETRTAIVQEL